MCLQIPAFEESKYACARAWRSCQPPNSWAARQPAPDRPPAQQAPAMRPTPAGLGYKVKIGLKNAGLTVLPAQKGIKMGIKFNILN